MELNETIQNAGGSAADAVVRPTVDRRARFSLAGELVAAVTHDLRQPLTAIEMNVSAAMHLLRRPEASVDDVLAALSDALEQEHRMRDAIQMLHDLSARRAPRREPCDIASLARDALTLVRSDALARHVVIVLDADTAIRPVVGDEAFIRHALLNLLLEGLDVAAPSAGQPASIHVTARSVGDSAEVAMAIPLVAATGGGAHDATEWDLALARSIVTIHGGTLTIGPDGAGGVVVTTTWPRADASTQTPVL
jgi:signal transduction histidine kinase